MTEIIIEEKIFCQYCKQPINSNGNADSHAKCEKLIQKYNNRSITKLRKKIYLNHYLKKKLNWEKNKNIIYTIIYSLGGINIISIIVIYQLVFGFRS